MTDINERDEKGETKLFKAAEIGDVNQVARLLTDKANPELADNEGLTPLHIASWLGKEKVVRVLIDAHVNVETVTNIGDTPLILAAFKGHEKVVRMLIDARANVDAGNNEAMTAIHFAAQRGHFKIVHMLAKARANMHAADNEGDTPMIYAAWNGRDNVLLTFMAWGMTGNEPTNKGFTAFQNAACNGKPDSIKLLSAAGVNENALDNDGDTALNDAINNEIVESVRALLELNVDTRKATTNDDTPAEIVALLEQHEQRSKEERKEIRERVLVEPRARIDKWNVDNAELVISAKVHINAPTSWFVRNVPRLLKDKPASEEIDEAIKICLRNNRIDVAQLLIEATHSTIKAYRFKSIDDLLKDHFQAATSLRDARSLTAVHATAQLLDVLPRTKSIAPIADAVVALEAELRQQQTTISNDSFASKKALDNAIARRDAVRVALRDKATELARALSESDGNVLILLKSLEKLPKFDKTTTTKIKTTTEATKTVVSNDNDDDVDDKVELRRKQQTINVDDDEEVNKSSSNKRRRIEGRSLVDDEATLRAWIARRETAAQLHADELKTQQQQRATQLAAMQQFYANNDNDDVATCHSALEAFVESIGALRDVANRALAAVANADALPTASLLAVTARAQALVDEHHAAAATLTRVQSFEREFALCGDKCPNDEHVQALIEQQTAQRKTLKMATRALEDAHEEKAKKTVLVKCEADVVAAKRQLRQTSLQLEKATFELALIAGTHYPELRHRYPTLGLERIVASSGVERAARDIESYENKEVLPTGGNHRVMKATYDRQLCVLKEFNLRESKDKSLFMNEVKRLHALHHPCVVDVQACFVSTQLVSGVTATLGFIQLPYYEGGDLSRWLFTKDRITDAQRQLVLQTALQGLMFVHGHNIVHCDVKPANIFVTRDGTGVLGDFDVSQDDTTRATMASAAATKVVVGATWDYMAPELVSSAATKSSDMYSFGLTVFDLHFRPRADDSGVVKYQRATLHEQLATRQAIVAVPEYANESVATALRELLTSLLALDATKRATATQALAQRYFRLALGGVDGARDAQRDRRSCVIDLEGRGERGYWRDEGGECGGAHFVADAALQGLVRSLAQESAGKHNGTVKCPAYQCQHRFNAQQIARHCPNELDAFMRMVKSALELELERGFDERLQRELAAAEKAKDVAAHRRHIVDKLLVLACPRCAQVFVDFEGCFALTCSRCRTSFCGWCLVDCGEDAHRHVAQCPLNRANGNIFGTQAQFDQCHRERRAQLVRDYFAQLPANIDRVALRAAIQRDLQELHIEL